MAEMSCTIRQLPVMGFESGTFFFPPKRNDFSLLHSGLAANRHRAGLTRECLSGKDADIDGDLGQDAFRVEVVARAHQLLFSPLVATPETAHGQDRT